MIAVSDAWKANQNGLIVSESFVEITFVGTDIVFNKSDITRYTHEQDGCLLSGKLPINKITFSADNSRGKYNPNTTKFFEHQKITVRYGFTINGITEWIKAGTFYLTEWHTPNNGLETSFEARDLLAFFMDKPYSGITSGSLKAVAENAVEQAGLPADAVVVLDSVLTKYHATITTERSLAEVLQLCANAGCCVMWQDRDGILRIQRISNVRKDGRVQHAFNMVSDYVISTGWAYSYPEYEASKPLKSVKISYGNNKVKGISVGSVGETQSVSNELITIDTQADELARWAAALLENKKTISGEFRADPRLDIFDKVKVESKYGENEAVIITNITYNFTGAFRCTYEGYVSNFDAITNAYYSGDLFAGEV